jgi:ribonuclease HI
MKGNWKVNGGLYVDRYKETKKLFDTIHLMNPSMKIRFHWVPREQNQQADQLSNDAYWENTKI